MRNLLGPGVAGLLLAAGALVGCASDDGGPSDPAPETGASAEPVPPSASMPSFDPPRDSRWVGIGDVVLAVPEDWGTTTEPCGAPTGPTVYFVTSEAARVDCAQTPTDGVSSVLLADNESGLVYGGRALDIFQEVNGVDRAVHERGCGAASGQCRIMVMTSRQHGLAAVIRVRGENAAAQARKILDSLTVVPKGWVTVPLVEYGEEVADVKRRLADAGLVAHSPDVDYPHYATGTEPGPGSVVEVGSMVEITIGDG